MSKSKAIALGVFTMWPIFYVFLFMILVAVMMLTSSGLKHSNTFGIVFALHLLTILEMYALLAIYIYVLYKTQAVPADKKTLWAVVLFLGNIIAMPIYWYYYIWSPIVEVENRPDFALAQDYDQ